jgi:hypothetical protein
MQADYPKIIFQNLQQDQCIMAVISDWRWFLSQEEPLSQWLQDHNVVHQGMTLTFPDQSTVFWFTVTWL